MLPRESVGDKESQEPLITGFEVITRNDGIRDGFDDDQDLAQELQDAIESGEVDLNEFLSEQPGIANSIDEYRAGQSLQ